MTNPLASCERAQSLGEEIVNCISHGVGLLAALGAVPVLMLGALRRGDAADIVGASIFAATVVMLYLASTLYHALPSGRAKDVFRLLDHGAIYLLIAGTYTPFTLGVMRGAWGWTLFGIVWSLAAMGIVLRATGAMKHPWLSTLLYIAMGWLVLIAAKHVCLVVPYEGLVWLLIGGIAYTAGVVFYASDRILYFHFVWHVFVLVGTTCHFIAVVGYAV